MLNYRRYIGASPSDVLAALETEDHGLSDAVVVARRLTHGRNTITQTTPAWYAILWRQVNSFFTYLLAAAALINLTLGEYLDGGLIVAFIAIYIGVGFYQEFHAENAVAALTKFLQRYARVRRDGRLVHLPLEDLVPGDIVVLHEGDQVPADVRLLDAQNLLVDETIITGESVPVIKENVGEDPERLANDLEARNLAFFGTAVVGGWATAVVVATGARTYVASLVTELDRIERPSLFELNIQRIGRFLTQVTIAVAIGSVAAKLLLGQDLSIGFLVFLVALIISVIPEGLPIVVTLAFSKGALKLAKEKVIIKRLTALEDLGNVTVLCTDKTGTITKNNLAITSRYGSDPMLIEYALAASVSQHGYGKLHNPFDLAIQATADPEVQRRVAAATINAVLPFDAVRKQNSIMVTDAAGTRAIVRGAPELIIPRCRQLEAAAQRQALDWFTQRGLSGERVLAVAYRSLPAANIGLAAAEQGELIFAGLLGFADELKDTSRAAFELMKKLGVDLKIITGDAVEVAGAVGAAVGLIADPGQVLTGEAFERMNGTERREAVHRYHVFARTLPHHKLEIINHLKERHQVAFLGEGFNDVPALKTAQVALVVQSGADMAKNVADVVLAEDDLLVIAHGIAEGRKIFTNVLKYIRSTLASNLGNFFSVLVASFLLPFLPMLPLQILLVNLLSDFPMIAISLDRVSPRELGRPQRYDLPALYRFVVIFGLVSSVFDFLFFTIFRAYGEPVLQTGWFMFSIITEIIVFFSLRSTFSMFRGGLPAPALIVLSVGIIGLCVALPLIGLSQQLFHFVTLGGTQLAILFGAALAYLAINEIVKLIIRTGKPPEPIGNGKLAVGHP